MKKMILSILPFFILLGCNQEENDVQRPSIYGTWQLIESYNVSGVDFYWREVPKELKYEFTIAFNNTFRSTRYSDTEYSDCSGGNVKYDDVQITFEDECGGPGLSYNYYIDGNKLTLIPNFLFCDEGCGDRFQKIAEPESGE